MYEMKEIVKLHSIAHYFPSPFIYRHANIPENKYIHSNLYIVEVAIWLLFSARHRTTLTLPLNNNISASSSSMIAT